MTRLSLLFAAIGAALLYNQPWGGAWPALGLLVLSLLWPAFRFRRHIRRRLAARTLSGLRALSPAAFEAEVAAWLRREGWHVEPRGGTGDGGIDLLAHKRGQTMAVQCKRYAETAAVSAAQVRDLYGAATALGATSATLVTTGRVSRAATAWCAELPPGLPVRLIEAEELGRLAARQLKFTTQARPD